MAKKSIEKLTLKQKIHHFINYNALVVVGLIAFVVFHQIFIVGSTVKSLETEQKKMVKYLKDNVSKVYFLSANGQLLSAKKGAISYSDERFKSYLANNITDNLIGGSIWLTENFKIVYNKPEDIILKNKRFNTFYTNFIKPQGSVISKYATDLFKILADKKLPEYIIITSVKYDRYNVYRPSKENNFQTTIEATITVNTSVKSWIADLNKWDTRIVSIRVKYKVVVNTDKYANVGNPWGVHFYNLEIPIIVKPEASSLVK